MKEVKNFSSCPEEVQLSIKLVAGSILELLALEDIAYSDEPLLDVPHIIELLGDWDSEDAQFFSEEASPFQSREVGLQDAIDGLVEAFPCLDGKIYGFLAVALQELATDEKWRKAFESDIAEDYPSYEIDWE